MLRNRERFGCRVAIVPVGRVFARVTGGHPWTVKSYRSGFTALHRPYSMNECSMKKARRADLIAAAAYLRMSSDDQRTSIQQQEAEVRALAERDGYEIVNWYREEGKSGSKDQEQRTEFQRMLVDAVDAPFKAVLCYDSARFARLDSIDGAVAKQVLRSKGIYLVTVKEGRIDWTTFEGRVMDMLDQRSQPQVFARPFQGQPARPDGSAAARPLAHWVRAVWLRPALYFQQPDPQGRPEDAVSEASQLEADACPQRCRGGHREGSLRKVSEGGHIATPAGHRFEPPRHTRPAR